MFLVFIQIKFFWAVAAVQGFNLAENGNFNRTIRTSKLPWRVFTLPVVGQLYLIAVFKLLLKQAVFIADAVAKARNAERGH